MFASIGMVAACRFQQMFSTLLLADSQNNPPAKTQWILMSHVHTLESLAVAVMR